MLIFYTAALCTTVKYVPDKYGNKWELLNINYMSEEDGCDGTIVVIEETSMAF